MYCKQIGHVRTTHWAASELEPAMQCIMAQAPIQLQRHERGSSAARRGSSTLQKIAQKKEQLKLYPRIKKLERIATHLACEVREWAPIGMTNDQSTLPIYW